jgi:catechol 2,3-dioxygenase-like lactoylglutathione lyase family enzyme
MSAARGPEPGGGGRDPLVELWSALFQQAFVVSDMDAARDWFGHHFHVPRWLEIPEVSLADATMRGEPAPHTLQLAFGYSGDVQIELIRPVEGGGPAAAFLAATGGGPHHLGYLVGSADRRDRLVAAFAARGVGVLMEGTFGAGGFTYFDTRPLVTEVITDVDGSVAGMFGALQRGELP